MSSPLLLKDYFIDKVFFEALKVADLDNLDEDIVKLDVRVQRSKENKKDFFMTLEIKVNSDRESKKKVLYRYELTIFGVFTTGEGIEETNAIKMIGPLGITNLYGVARGILGQLSGLSPYDRIVLPSINVYEHLSRSSDQGKEVSKRIKKNKAKLKTKN